MGVEIERKFLVLPNRWNVKGEGMRIRQGYLSTDPERNVRIRICDKEALLTIKGKTVGISRTELEYPIHLKDAEVLLDLCHRPLIEKTRFEIPAGELKWEVDIFEGENEGLMIAEIELPDEQTTFTIPAWIGEEVTTDFRYSNSSLCEKPFKDWD